LFPVGMGLSVARGWSVGLTYI